MRDVLIKYSNLPFQYGEDCCTFAGECVESMTGSNPMDRFDYKNKRQAYRIINNFGSLEGAMIDALGQPYGGMKDGDVCLLSANDGTDAAGVIYHDRVVARTESGLMDFPLDRAKKVWCT